MTFSVPTRMSPPGALLAALFVITTIIVTDREADAEENRIAVVNPQRVLVECREGLHTKAALRRIFDGHQADLDQREEELRNLRSRIESSPTGSPERRRLESQYQAKLAELQAVYLRYQQELNQAEALHTQRILGRIRQVIESIRREGSYAVVLELNPGQPPPQGAGAAIDVTQRVITRYDAQFGDGTSPNNLAPSSSP